LEQVVGVKICHGEKSADGARAEKERWTDFVGLQGQITGGVNKGRCTSS